MYTRDYSSEPRAERRRDTSRDYSSEPRAERRRDTSRDYGSETQTGRQRDYRRDYGPEPRAERQRTYNNSRSSYDHSNGPNRSREYHITEDRKQAGEGRAQEPEEIGRTYSAIDVALSVTFLETAGKTFHQPQQDQATKVSAEQALLAVETAGTVETLTADTGVDDTPRIVRSHRSPSRTKAK
eukprot:GHVU01189556.1.p2 GENE.GHVU01189556.1~~GHVU01189556.1.p2  ORF type:complete len:183 (-),score=4.92 GHVU01189556.1:178-726(-)